MQLTACFRQGIRFVIDLYPHMRRYLVNLYVLPRLLPFPPHLGLQEMSSGGGMDASNSGVSSLEYSDSLSVKVSEADNKSIDNEEWSSGGLSAGFGTDVSDTHKRRRRDNQEHIQRA